MRDQRVSKRLKNVNERYDVGVTVGAATPSHTGREFGWRHLAHHRRIGICYLLVALLAVGLGTALSLLMRLHRILPDLPLPFHGAVRPEDYLAWVTMHGTLMVFFVLTVAPQQGFANLVLPEQVGAQQMALPLINAAGLWLTVLAFALAITAFLVPGGAPIGGWSAYPPLSVFADAGPGQGYGMDVWLGSLAVFCVASLMGGVNTVVTVARCRCKGMIWSRLPMTVWSWLVSAYLSILVFSVLLAAMVMIVCDRHAGTAFFTPASEWVNGVVQTRHGDGSPLLWLHLFWFFGHPEVYIAILPGMGLVTMLLGNFTRRRIPAYRWMIVTTLAIGCLGVLVWGHHMFVAGLNPFAGTAFELTTIAIALPSTAKVLNWLVIVWRSKPALQTPMLWSLGFVSIFVAGGISGPILAQPALDAYLHNTFFVVAHFHLVMAMGAVFGIFAGVAYWFPLVTGRMLGEPLGKVHFWWTLFFAYNTFLPMHLTGLAGEPRHYERLTGLAGVAGALVRGTVGLERHITASALLLGLGQTLWIWNVAISLRNGKPAMENPWSATTMEWAPALDGDASRRMCYREPCHYSTPVQGDFALCAGQKEGFHPAHGEFLPQWASEREAE